MSLPGRTAAAAMMPENGPGATCAFIMARDEAALEHRVAVARGALRHGAVHRRRDQLYSGFTA
jgi:hypothetical protein